MLTPEDLVQIELIKQLKSLYFQTVDDKDYVTMATLFTDDAIVDFTAEFPHHAGHHGALFEPPTPPPTPVVGGSETARVIAAAIDGTVTVHHGHDPRISMTSETTATGRWSLYDLIEYDDEVMHGYGHYEETYTRTDDGWRFSSLTLTRLRVAWESTS